MTLRFGITLLHVCNVLDLQNRKLNSMKTMSTGVEKQGKFHYSTVTIPKRM